MSRDRAHFSNIYSSMDDTATPFGYYGSNVPSMNQQQMRLNHVLGYESHIWRLLGWTNSEHSYSSKGGTPPSEMPFTGHPHPHPQPQQQHLQPAPVGPPPIAPIPPTPNSPNQNRKPAPMTDLLVNSVKPMSPRPGPNSTPIQLSRGLKREAPSQGGDPLPLSVKDGPQNVAYSSKKQCLSPERNSRTVTLTRSPPRPCPTIIRQGTPTPDEAPRTKSPVPIQIPALPHATAAVPPMYYSFVPNIFFPHDYCSVEPPMHEVRRPLYDTSKSTASLASSYGRCLQ